MTKKLREFIKLDAYEQINTFGTSLEDLNRMVTHPYTWDDIEAYEDSVQAGDATREEILELFNGFIKEVADFENEAAKNKKEELVELFYNFIRGYVAFQNEAAENKNEVIVELFNKFIKEVVVFQNEATKNKKDKTEEPKA